MWHLNFNKLDQNELSHHLILEIGKRLRKFVMHHVKAFSPFSPMEVRRVGEAEETL